MSVELVVARLEAVHPDVPVFDGGVDDSVTGRYWLVTGNTPMAASEDLADTRRRRDATVWVTSVAEVPIGTVGGRAQAAWQAGWLATQARDALIGWRPTPGGWKPVHVASVPPDRDEDLPDRIVYSAVDTYGLSSQV